ncbi:MAG: AmmeMemoRadiSam system radical SAM enzyme [Streptosporangiaceae bacterium]|nr:AmmeMemoRadiSam system radical SAM enzyme [Streptosporangiaceae bacterium]
MEWVTAALYEPAGDRLACTLCPVRCKLADGQVGACHVRRRTGDRLETRTFATTVRHYDAVERKPLYHFRPGSTVLTLAAPGCTFRCTYCVNHRISQYGRDDDVPWQAEPVDPAEVVELAASRGASVALSYSEPSLAIELTLALAALGAGRGVGIIWKSNGFLTEEALALAAPALAAVNIDIKAADEERHHQLTGAPLAPVLASLRALHARGVWVEVATPLIPGVSASPPDLARIAAIIASVDPGIPWHLLRYTPAYRRSDDLPTLPDALADGVRIGREAGLRYVYVERALGPRGRETRCPACGVTVVSRDLWALRELRLKDGACSRCGTAVEGRWDR